MGRTACTEPQCLYKGALYLTVELYLYSPLWAVRPVQSLSACTRVHFTFTFTMTENIEFQNVCKETAVVYINPLKLSGFFTYHHV